jgi:hypothetical protein
MSSTSPQVSSVDSSHVSNPPAIKYDLQKDGICVIKPSWMIPETQNNLRQEFITTCRNFPEYSQSVENNQYVIGGFAALGNPASFHNEFVRKLRQWALHEVLHVFRPLRNGRKLEQDIDRMLWRIHNLQPSAETWHRDEAKTASEDDDVFGGWWNLDSKPQYFSCVFGTHHKTQGFKGFAKISKEEAKIYKNLQKERGGIVEIPPGCIMVFYENLVHEILAKKAPKEGNIRLFLGWRLTNLPNPLISNLDKLLEDQAVVPLKSGQIPWMWATMCWVFHKQKIQDWTAKSILGIEPSELNKQTDISAYPWVERKTVQTGNKKGEVYIIVKQQMSSLKDYNLKMYTPYDESEKRLYYPNDNWEVLESGSSNKKVKVRF